MSRKLSTLPPAPWAQKKGIRSPPRWIVTNDVTLRFEGAYLIRTFAGDPTDEESWYLKDKATGERLIAAPSGLRLKGPLPPPIVLETPRLLMRPHGLHDGDFMIALNADYEVVRYTGDTALANLSETLPILARLQREFRERRMGRFVVLERHSGARIGWCGLKWQEHLGTADLGYRFLRAEWGQGYATESARECVRYGFETLGLTRIVADVMAENRASIRVLEKLGFRHTGLTVCEGFPAERYERRVTG